MPYSSNAAKLDLVRYHLNWQSRNIALTGHLWEETSPSNPSCFRLSVWRWYNAIIQYAEHVPFPHGLYMPSILASGGNPNSLQDSAYTSITVPRIDMSLSTANAEVGRLNRLIRTVGLLTF